MKRQGRRRRPQLFLKGRSPGARRRLLAVFVVIFGAAAAPRARAACVELATPAELLPQLGTVFSIAPGDVDQDGDTDLLVAADYDSIYWYLNLGTAWTSAVVTGFYPGVRRAEAVDVDNDGDLDVVAASKYDERIDWFESAGDGIGWGQRTIATGLADLGFAHAADLDGDGHVDVVARYNVPVEEPPPDGFPRPEGETPPYSALGLWANGGDGDSWVGASLDEEPDLQFSHALAAADLNGDGNPDLIEANSYQPLVWRAGNGVFGFAGPQTISTAFPSESSVAAVDLDRDGDLDLVAASLVGSRVRFYENTNGAGTAWAITTITTLSGGPSEVAPVDLDADGDLDVLVTSQGDFEIAWHESDGFALTTWTRHTVTTLAFGALAVAAADLDRDGDPDVAGAGNFSNQAGIFENLLLAGAPLHAPTFTISTGFSTLTSVEVADFDRDGDLDALSSSSGDSTITWFQSDGEGVDWGRRDISTAAGAFVDARPADIDGDGNVDVLAVTYVGDDVVWFENDGTPTTGSWTLHTIHGALSNGAKAAVAGDLDRDGDLDVVTAADVGDDLHWFENNGVGTLWTAVTISEAVNGANDVALADLDRDGDLDVAAAGRIGGTVSWFLNDGTPEGGGWTESAVATPGGAPESIAAADLDRDGDLDLLVSLAGGDASLWYENDGEASGWAPHTIATGLDNLLTSRVGDVDADGDLDVVTATLVSNDVVWFLNDGAGGGWTRVDVATGLAGAIAAVPLDLDRDGDLDVLTGFRLSGGGVVWHENRGTKVHDDGFDSDANLGCWSANVP